MLNCSSWHGGQLLAFSGLDGETDYAHGLTARTAFDGPAILFTLPGRGRVTFPEALDRNICIAGDWFTLGAGPVVTGVLLDACHLLIQGACAVSEMTPALSVLRKGNRTLVGSTSCFDPGLITADADLALQARRGWLESLRFPEKVPPRAERTLVKAWSILKSQVYSPEGRIRHRWTTPDRWPHRQMWLWDSAFHAIGLRHLDPALARDAIRAVFDMQSPDGFVPHRMNPSDHSSITQPPILALSAKLTQDVEPDEAWLRDLYPRLRSYLEWDLHHRDREHCGLLSWQIDGDPLCRSGESGMDNSPRFDAATRLEAVDFNSYLSQEYRIMAGFARELGLTGEAVSWMARHEQLNQRISSRLWSDEAGFFLDLDSERGAHSPILASSGFLPLICGAATKKQASRLAECLTDSTKFGTAFPVPSIAAFDVDHYAKDMWRGPVWVNINWLIARGLEDYGFLNLAENLRTRTLEEIEKGCEDFGTLFEFYDDRGECPPPHLLRKGECAPESSPYHQVFHDYGWTAALYVDFAYTRHG
jgi:hypothetical protein